ncbi:MAG: T9SS C-terminal target domain-containing protein [Ignavibacteriae bacterium]|nr:MAG: T9SS C-terminal target domain-containing protein [Ignavibacteriota bacterium]
MKNIFIFFFLIVISTASVISGDWITIGGNSQRNGQSVDIGPSSATVYWNKPTLSSYWGMQVFIYGDKCVTSRYTSLSPLTAPLVCHNLNTGDSLWTRNYAPNGVMVVMGFNNNKIYVRNFQQQGVDSFYAINPDNGNIIWKSNFTLERGITWAAIFAPNGDLFVPGSGTKSIMRINHTNGDTVWTKYRIIPNTGAETMCLYGNTLYTWEGSLVTPKRIAAFDANTGAIKYYSAALPGDGDQEIPFSIGPNGTIYAIRDGGLLYALKDNGTGFNQLWTYQPVTPLGTYSQFGAGRDSTVYIPSGRRILHFNHQTGAVLDSSEELSSSGYINPRITVGADGKLYVGNGASVPSDGKVFCLSSNLQTIWSVPLAYNYYSGPALGTNGILVVNGNGTNIIAYRTSVGVSSNNNLPAGFSLEQNYPNPFNPSTKIKFNIPGKNNVSSSNVRLVIYDILSREVETLIDKNLYPGSYEVEWNAAGYTSGIYFYKLEYAGNIIVKNMTLIK